MQDELQGKKKKRRQEESPENQFQIRVSINADYRAFDLAGKLPLNIIFGLCLHVKAEAPESRPIVFDVSGSVFDVPYALANGLLTLYDKTKNAKVDLGDFDAPASEHSYLTLHPKVKVLKLYVDKIHAVPLTPESKLAKLLDPNSRYQIRLANRQLGINWWAYGHPDDVLVGGIPTRPSESGALVCARGTGVANFRVVESLSWPPPVEIRMSIQSQSEAGDPASSWTLEFSITNRGEETIVVQSSGHQRFLNHWGPYQPDPGPEDRVRITAMSENSGSGCLVVTNAETGDVPFPFRRPICVLMAANADRRPRRRDLTVLEPSKTFKKQVDLSRNTARLPDGVYQVELEAMGATWFQGNLTDLYGSDAPDEYDRVPRGRCATLIPPLWLSCADTVKICVRDGKWEPPL